MPTRPENSIVDLQARLSRGEYMVEPARVAEVLIARLAALGEARRGRREADRILQTHGFDHQAR